MREGERMEDGKRRWREGYGRGGYRETRVVEAALSKTVLNQLKDGRYKTLNF